MSECVRERVKNITEPWPDKIVSCASDIWVRSAPVFSFSTRVAGWWHAVDDGVEGSVFVAVDVITPFVAIGAPRNWSTCLQWLIWPISQETSRHPSEQYAATLSKGNNKTQDGGEKQEHIGRVRGRRKRWMCLLVLEDTQTEKETATEEERAYKTNIGLLFQRTSVLAWVGPMDPPIVSDINVNSYLQPPHLR